MLALEDYGMDPEFTGKVTEAERAELAAIYANWDAGFAGDLYPLLGGRPLDLTGPLQVVADVQEGRLVIAHRRGFPDRPQLGAEELVLQVYDPSYFTAYTIAADPTIRGREDCAAEVWGPDWEAASARLLAALEELSGSADPEEDFPAVGADFAEEVRLRCADPS
jgi:polyphosphate kinase